MVASVKLRLGRVVILSDGQTDSLARETDKIVDVFVEHARFRNASGSIPQQYVTLEQARQAELAAERARIVRRNY